MHAARPANDRLTIVGLDNPPGSRVYAGWPVRGHQGEGDTLENAIIGTFDSLEPLILVVGPDESSTRSDFWAAEGWTDPLYLIVIRIDLSSAVGSGQLAGGDQHPLSSSTWTRAPASGRDEGPVGSLRP